jgi:hypothetical protein
MTLLGDNLQTGHYRNGSNDGGCEHTEADIFHLRLASTHGTKNFVLSMLSWLPTMSEGPRFAS